MEEGKKLIIYRRIDENTVETLRAVTVHFSFIGIGRNGQYNPFEFKRLAQDLEPSHTFYTVINL